MTDKPLSPVDHAPRCFADDAAVRRVGEGLLSRTLPRDEWTHEAHLAACLWLVRERPDIDAETALPDIIRSYNESVGGVNDDTQGYHHTVTMLYLAGVRAHLATSEGGSLVALVNALVTGEGGRRDWPMRLYSRDRLFSVDARRGWVAPDRDAVPDHLPPAALRTASK